jgi:hypothetical protein
MAEIHFGKKPSNPDKLRKKKHSFCPRTLFLGKVLGSRVRRFLEGAKNPANQPCPRTSAKNLSENPSREHLNENP